MAPLGPGQLTPTCPLPTTLALTLPLFQFLSLLLFLFADVIRLSLLSLLLPPTISGLSHNTDSESSAVSALSYV